MIVEHPDVAAYYAAVFEDDWDASDGSGANGAREPDRIKIAAAACILIALTGLYLYRRRRA